MDPDNARDNARDITGTPQNQCMCGRTFLGPGGLKKHLNSCSKSKKRFASALEKVKEMWTSRKKPRIQFEGSSQLGGRTQPTPAGAEGSRSADNADQVVRSKFCLTASDKLLNVEA